MAFHLLVVEDEEMLAKLLSLQLENAGHTVTTVGTGVEMLEKIVTEDIDLVVLDLGLPDGDGLSLIHAVRETSSVPIIVSTARKSEADREMALGLGANGYVTKPIDIPALLDLVTNILRQETEASITLIDEAAHHARVDILKGTPQPPSSAPVASDKTHRSRSPLILVFVVLVAAGSAAAYWQLDSRSVTSSPPNTRITAKGPIPTEPASRSGQRNNSAAPSSIEAKMRAPNPTGDAKSTAKPRQSPPSTDGRGGGVSPFEALMRTPAPNLPLERGIKAGTTDDQPTRTPRDDEPSNQTASREPAAQSSGTTTKHFAEVLGFGWVLTTKCGDLPTSQHWKIKNNLAAAGHVQRTYKGNWAPYVAYWEKRTANLKAIDAAGLTAKVPTGKRISGSTLKAYVATMENRLKSVKCLAAEAASAPR